jgi:hypothetical protein
MVLVLMDMDYVVTHARYISGGAPRRFYKGPGLRPASWRTWTYTELS